MDDAAQEVLTPQEQAEETFIDSPQVRVTGGPIVERAKQKVNAENYRGVSDIVVVHTADDPTALGYVTNKDDKSRVVNIVLSRNIDQAKKKLEAKYGKDAVASLPKEHIDEASVAEVVETIIHETGHVPKKGEKALQDEVAAKRKEKQNEAAIKKAWEEVFKNIESYLENDVQKAASAYAQLIKACSLFERLVLLG